MKLKFTKDAQAVIDEIAKLPTQTLDPELAGRPHQVINEYDSKVRGDLKKFPSPNMKEWSRERRQVSFFFEFVRIANERETERLKQLHPNPDPVKQLISTKVPETAYLDRQNLYSTIVTFFRDLKSEKLLEDPYFVKLALGYGIVYLSDKEVQHLIELNER